MATSNFRKMASSAANTNLLPCRRPRRDPGGGHNAASSPSHRGGVCCGPRRPSVPAISGARNAISAGNSVVLETSDAKRAPRDKERERKGRQGTARVKQDAFFSTNISNTI